MDVEKRRPAGAVREVNTPPGGQCVGHDKAGTDEVHLAGEICQHGADLRGGDGLELEGCVDDADRGTQCGELGAQRSFAAAGDGELDAALPPEMARILEQEQRCALAVEVVRDEVNEWLGAGGGARRRDRHRCARARMRGLGGIFAPHLADHRAATGGQGPAGCLHRLHQRPPGAPEGERRKRAVRPLEEFLVSLAEARDGAEMPAAIRQFGVNTDRDGLGQLRRQVEETVVAAVGRERGVAGALAEKVGGAPQGHFLHGLEIDRREHTLDGLAFVVDPAGNGQAAEERTFPAAWLVQMSVIGPRRMLQVVASGGAGDHLAREGAGRHRIRGRAGAGRCAGPRPCRRRSTACVRRRPAGLPARRRPSPSRQGFPTARRSKGASNSTRCRPAGSVIVTEKPASR